MYNNNYGDREIFIESQDWEFLKIHIDSVITIINSLQHVKVPHTCSYTSKLTKLVCVCVCVSLTVLNCIKNINKKDSLYLVIRTVAILGKDDDRPRVDLYTFVELFASHVPHSWTRRDGRKRWREKKDQQWLHMLLHGEILWQWQRLAGLSGCGHR